MQPADQSTLKGVAASLTWQPLTGDGLARTATSPTVTVTRSDGTALVTDAATTGTRPVTYTLAATHTAQLDRLTVTWKEAGAVAATTYVDIVGAYICPIESLMQRYPTLRDGTKYTTADLIDVRNAVEDRFEDACGVSFVPKFNYEVLEGSGDDCLQLERQELRAVTWANYRYEGTTGTTAFPTAAIQSIERSSSGEAEFTNGQIWPCEAIIHIGYEHGLDRPPADIVEAFQVAFWHVLTSRNSSVDRRTTQVVFDGVTTNLAVPGWSGNVFGIPEVDEVLKRYDRRVPGVA